MREKTIVALTSAIKNLEDSTEALINKSESEVGSSVWKASADLEYALFLFSIMKQDETKNPSLKFETTLKEADFGSILVLAKDLLKKAISNIDAGDLWEAYRKTWMARGHLWAVWKHLNKVKRSETK